MSSSNRRSLILCFSRLLIALLTIVDESRGDVDPSPLLPWGSPLPSKRQFGVLPDRPQGMVLVYARDGISSRTAASASIAQSEKSGSGECSGGSCSSTLVPPGNPTSNCGNTTRPQGMRGGSMRVSAPEPLGKDGLASATTSSSTEQSALNSSHATTRHNVGDSSSADETNEMGTANNTKSEEHSPKSATSSHQETRREKRERLKRHKQIAKKLKNRNARNLRRKVLHACFGLTFAGLNHWLPKSTFVPCMAFLSSATLVMELLRYRKGFGWMNAALHGVLGQSLRKHEMEGKFTGSFYFFTGVTLTSWLFDSTSATLGICQLALADPSASYFGRKTRHIYWSRIENGLGGFGRNKGVLGFLGGALFCFPFNFRVVTVAVKHSGAGTSTIVASTPILVSASLLLGLAGAFADLAVPTPALVLPKKILGIRVPPFHVDDNMVVPIFSAYACQEIFKALGLGQVELSRWVLF